MADNYCKCCGDGTPEYIIELNQQGAPGKRGEKGEQGYSPVVDFIANNDEIKFTSTNEDNITSTPNLYDFLAKKDLSNVSNLYDLLLKRDGSNATNTFILNNIRFITNHSATQRISSLNSTGLSLSGNPLQLDGEAYSSFAYPNRIMISESGQDITLGNTNKANIIINNDMATYNGNELATVNNISNSKITISQGDVVKGSFTLNQSGDTTIKLDTGVTNPLKIEGATEDNPSGGTVTYSMELGLDSSNQVYLDYITSYYTSTGGFNYSTSENIIKDNLIATALYKRANIYDSDVNRRLTIGYDTDSKLYIRNYLTNSGNTYKSIAPITSDIINYPIYLEEVTGTPGLEGAYTIKLNYDNNTLKLNESNQLYTDFTEVNNSISELTTLANNTEASLNGLKTDYETNKTEVAGELTTLGNQINTKVSKTELDELANTKNDNIFDIGKFTVVGSPTITDDGVASGFSNSNRIRIPFPSSVTNFTAELNFKFNDTSITSYSDYCIHATTSPFMIYINASNGKYGNINAVFTNSDISTQYNFGDISGSSHFLTERVYFEYRLLNNILSCRARFGETGDWINFPTTYTITDAISTKAYSLLASRSSAFNCDLKHFSITVDGEEVFNGLMSSTVPIYDKITTTNTTLSTFQTDTTNNFSAVNSALNEKASLSDLANYVPLATYNALLARVEALEAEINGGNA